MMRLNPSAANTRRARLEPPPKPGFSPREIDCLSLLVQGLTDREIARDLAITHATVRFHLDSARRKANARSRTHLAALAVSLGVAQP
jgi:DNA-binding CsgD family transcriptional regulator